MSCAYSVGVILALVENYKLVQPYVVIGSSGSSNTLAYYVAEQYRLLFHIWSNLLSNRNFIFYWRFWKVMDIDYMIDTIFKKQGVLDVKKITKSKIKLLIPATNRANGTTTYFQNDGSVDIFEALRASSAASGLYGKPVVINGREYIDGAPSASFMKNIIKAKTEGAEKIIAIYNSNDDFISRLFLRTCAMFQNKNLKRTMLEYCKNDNSVTDPSVLVIKPSQKIPIKTLNNNREGILKTIKLGYQDALIAPINSFLSK